MLTVLQFSGAIAVRENNFLKTKYVGPVALVCLVAQTATVRRMNVVVLKTNVLQEPAAASRLIWLTGLLQ